MAVADPLDPAEIAALRVKSSVLHQNPQEGTATRLLDALGTAFYNALAGPSRLVNAAMEEYQPGASVRDMPRTMEILPEVATDITGAPGVTGGVPGMGMGIRAYHGSPHDFDKFDLSKVGTGEGAQVYGHGLYFAENPSVARSYRDELAPLSMSDKTPLAAFSPEEWAARSLRDSKAGSTSPQYLANIAYAKQQLADYDKLLAAGQGSQERRDWWQRAADILQDWRNRGVEPVTLGRMYEVDIKAHPDQFLDWDKPLSQQPTDLQKTLNATFGDATTMLPNNVVQGRNGRWYTRNNETVLGRFDGWPDEQTAAEAMKVIKEQAIPNYTVGQWHKTMNSPLHQTEKMRDAGIPGIKYLDQGSRQTSGGELIDVFSGPQGWQSKIRMNRPNGEQYFTTSMPLRTEQEARQWAQGKIETPGTRNYVVFNDKIIDILRKYGIFGGALPLGSLMDAPGKLPQQ